MNKITDFKVGDIVEATESIQRFDGSSHLAPGETAKVSYVWQTTPDSPQIIALEIKGRLPMGDIVCEENHPLKRVEHEQTTTKP